MCRGVRKRGIRVPRTGYSHAGPPSAVAGIPHRFRRVMGLPCLDSRVGLRGPPKILLTNVQLVEYKMKDRYKSLPRRHLMLIYTRFNKSICISLTSHTHITPTSFKIKSNGT